MLRFYGGFQSAKRLFDRIDITGFLKSGKNLLFSGIIIKLNPNGKNSY